VSPDVTQPTHGLVKEDTLGGILFLRLKTGHLHPKHRLFKVVYYKSRNRDLKAKLMNKSV
jgi:hypothetical protein